MTDYTKLIERLYNSYDAETLCADAALVIEALQAECAEHKENAIRNARIAVSIRAERDQLQAENERLKDLELTWRICYERSSDAAQDLANDLATMQAKLYAAPKALAPLTDEQQRTNRHQINAMQSAYNVLTDGPMVRGCKYAREFAILDLKRCLDTAHGIGGTP